MAVLRASCPSCGVGSEFEPTMCEARHGGKMILQQVSQVKTCLLIFFCSLCNERGVLRSPCSRETSNTCPSCAETGYYRPCHAVNSSSSSCSVGCYLFFMQSMQSTVIYRQSLQYRIKLHVVLVMQRDPQAHLCHAMGARAVHAVQCDHRGDYVGGVHGEGEERSHAHPATPCA